MSSFIVYIVGVDSLLSNVTWKAVGYNDSSLCFEGQYDLTGERSLANTVLEFINATGIKARAIFLEGWPWKIG